MYKITCIYLVNKYTDYILKSLLRSNMSISNKLLVYKTLLHSIWTYGIILWGPSKKKTNIQTVQPFQFIRLGAITNAPWYITNKLLKFKSTLETAIIISYKRFHENSLQTPTISFHNWSQRHSQTTPSDTSNATDAEIYLPCKRNCTYIFLLQAISSINYTYQI